MSILASIVFAILKITRFKYRINFLLPKRTVRTVLPSFAKQRYNTAVSHVLGRRVLTIIPLARTSDAHVLFFHGGGYSLEASSAHFEFIRTFLSHANCTVSYIDYPLAPESTAETTVRMALESYKTLVSLYPHDHFVLMGDSAGAGLALSLAMIIRDSGLRAPEKLILFSPWLDITLSHASIPAYEHRDVILHAPLLREIGSIYRGGLSERDARVSPKFGGLHRLGSIAVFFGSEEIFRPDCMDVCAEKNIDSTTITAYEYPGMQHDWIIFPIPEAYHAIGRAAAFVNAQ